MKQHPIPQNILDVEFKLFTRFTIREFAYISIGIGFGGIFLYFYSRGEIPGFLAIPIFFISTAVGLILGLAKINDQNADSFVRNYIAAITRPTLRVWRSENFEEKIEWIAKQRGLTLTKGTLDRDINLEDKSNSRVVGGTAKAIPGAQYVNNQVLSALDQEEEEKLKQIDAVAMETIGDELSQNNISQQADPSSSFIETPVDQVNIPVAQLAVDPAQQPNVEESTTTDMTPPVIEGENDNLPPQNETIPDNSAPPEVDLTTPKVEMVEVAQQPPAVEPAAEQQTSPSSSVSAEKQVVINKDTVGTYTTQVEGFTPTPGTIALYVTTKDGESVPQAMVLIKDANGSVVQALQTDPQGLALPTKEVERGEYIVSIQHDKYKYPNVNFIMSGAVMPVVNIKSL